MKNLLVAVTCLAVILGIASTNLWFELRNERAVFADMHRQLSEARAAARPQAPPPAVPVATPAPVRVAAAPVAAIAECKPATPLPNANAAVADANRLNTTNLSISERDLLKDPEYRKARLAQRRVEVQRSNPGVVEALGLSGKAAEEFFDLLADYQLRSSELPVINRGVNPQAANEEQLRNRQALQKQQDEAIVALLGDNGFAQWQEYQPTRGARTQAVSMGSQLLQMGLPLTSAQMKPLTAAVIAEQRRQQQETQAMVRNMNPADPQARAAVLEETQRRSAESNRRILAAIAPSLSPQQLAVFREQSEASETMNAVSARARARAAGQRP